MKLVDEYFYRQTEPYQSVMLYARTVIFKTLPNINEKLSYRIPFYSMDKKPLLYLNRLKNTQFVDIAFVQGILLEADFPQLKNYNKRKQVRSLQINSLKEFDEALFIQLLKDASRYLANSDKAWFV